MFFRERILGVDGPGCTLVPLGDFRMAWDKACTDAELSGLPSGLSSTRNLHCDNTLPPPPAISSVASLFTFSFPTTASKPPRAVLHKS